MVWWDCSMKYRAGFPVVCFVCLFVCFFKYTLVSNSVLSNSVVRELISPGSSHKTHISSLQELLLCYIRENVESSSQWRKILHWKKLQKTSDSRKIDEHGLSLKHFITEFFTWSIFPSLFHLLTLVKYLTEFLLSLGRRLSSRVLLSVVSSRKW